MKEEGSQDTDEKFLGNGFRIKKLFGNITKTKNKVAKKVGVITITTQKVDSEIGVLPKSGTKVIESTETQVSIIGLENSLRNKLEPNEAGQIEIKVNDGANVNNLESDKGQSNNSQLGKQGENGHKIGKSNGSRNGFEGFYTSESEEGVSNDLPIKEPEFELAVQTKVEPEIELTSVLDSEAYLKDFESGDMESKTPELNEREITTEPSLKESGDLLPNELVPIESSLRIDEPKVPTKKDMRGVKSPKQLLKKLRDWNLDTKGIAKILNRKDDLNQYNKELRDLQIELVKLQSWVRSSKKRVAILFEGPDSIENRWVLRHFLKHLDVCTARTIALPELTEEENDQWYFQRWMNQLPKAGEMVFFDRSWYNRAIVEPVEDICTPEQYGQFLRQVPDFENVLYEDGVQVIKFWFSVPQKKLVKRFKKRKNDPLLKGNLSRIDFKVHKYWDDYVHYRELMFSKTHTVFNPWINVRAGSKKTALFESIKYTLSCFEYDKKDEANISLIPNPKIVSKCHRSAISAR